MTRASRSGVMLAVPLLDQVFSEHLCKACVSVTQGVLQAPLHLQLGLQHHGHHALVLALTKQAAHSMLSQVRARNSSSASTGGQLDGMQNTSHNNVSNSSNTCIIVLTPSEGRTAGRTCWVLS